MDNLYKDTNITPIADENDFIDLQLKLFDLLSRRVSKYTGGESSSVPAEIAQDLLASICYTLSIDQNITPQRIKALLSSDLDRQFQRGISALENKTRRAKKLWTGAWKTSPAIENISYTDTLRSLRDFPKKYDCEFFPLDIPCDIDYQLSNPVSEALKGVDYVNKYLEHIITENDFINRFAPARCIRLLNSSCPDYRGLLINLYEPIAVTAMGLALAEGDIFSLETAPWQRRNLEEQFSFISRTDALSLLEEAADRVLKTLGIKSLYSRKYLLKTAENLLPRINALLPEGKFDGIFF